MAKQKAYYWRGPGELAGKKAGEKVDQSKIDKPQLAKYIGDGRIQETAFGIDENTSVVAELQANIKALSEALAAKNKLPGNDDYECEDCKTAADMIAELEAQSVSADDKIIELEGLLEAATADKKKD